MASILLLEKIMETSNRPYLTSKLKIFSAFFILLFVSSQSGLGAQHNNALHIIFGGPGAGKGTAAGPLATRLQSPHISTGDLIRANKSKLSSVDLELMSGGGLGGSQIVVRLLGERLAAGDAHNGAILDGFPRKVEQIKDLLDLSKKTGIPVGTVIFINPPRDVLVKRLSGRRVCPACKRSYHIETNKPRVEGICDHDGHSLEHRSDDNPKAIETRLEVFEKETLPVLEELKKITRVIEVSGLGTPEEVLAEILSKMRGH